MLADMTLRRSLNRGTVLILLLLAILSSLAWLYLFTMSGGSEQAISIHHAAGHAAHAAHMPQGTIASWRGQDILLVFWMWSVMAIAMMLPTATTAILSHVERGQSQPGAGAPLLSATRFALGYLSVWIGFSLLATGAQWLLHRQELLTSMMGRVEPEVGGLLLLAAGLFQLTSLKHHYLRHCRTRTAPLTDVRGDHRTSELLAGLRHGTYCVVSCGALMSLMFVVGVMNLGWMVILTVLIALEKLLPSGAGFSHGMGVVLSGWALWLLLSAL
jgi:predicted metal-binding membrane protein